MRVGDEGLELREIIFQCPAVYRVVIGLDGLVLSANGVLDVLAGEVVAGEDPRLASGLDGHVGDGEPVGDADVLHIAVELERLVVRSIHTDVGDDPQDEVLPADVSVELALDDDLDGLGDLEPELAGGEHGCGLGGTYACGQRVHRTVCARVRIRTDDEPARGCEALLHHQLMAHSALPDLEVVRDLMLLSELAHLLGLGGRVDVLGRDVVVRDEDHLVLVQLIRAELVVFSEGDGAGDVVHHDVIHVGDDDLSSTGVLA